MSGIVGYLWTNPATGEEVLIDPAEIAIVRVDGAIEYDERRATAKGIAEALIERSKRFPDEAGPWWDGWRGGMIDASDTATAHAIPPEVRATMDAAMDAMVFGAGVATGRPRGILAALHSGEDPLP